MLDRVSGNELVYCMMLQQMDPIGPARSDLQHAIVGADLHNMWTVKKSGRKKPKDFLAGEWFRKSWEKHAEARGVKKGFDKKRFWGQIMARAVKVVKK